MFFFFMNDARDARESWIKSRYKRLASLVCKVSLRGMSTAVRCICLVAKLRHSVPRLRRYVVR